MPRLIRISAIIALSLIFLLVAAGILVANLINPNDYKDQIIASVNKATGRELSINGDIKLSFFPWLGVNVEKLELSNPAGFKQDSFLKVAEADIKLQILPLLFGKVEFGAIVLNNADLNLIKNSEKSDNWSDLKSNAQGSNTPSNDAKSAESNNSFFKKIKITTVSIKNSHLRWTDSTAKNVIELNNLNLDSSGIGLAKSFPIYLSFNLTDKNPKLNLQFNGNADAYLDFDKQIYQLDSLQINGQVSTPTASNLSFSAQGDTQVDLKQHAWNLKNFSANLAQMSLEITSKGDLSNSTSNGSIKIKSFNAQNLLQQINSGIKFYDPNALTNVSAQFSYTVTPDLVQVPDLKAKIDNTTLVANLDYKASKARSLNYLLQVDKINADHYQISMPRSTRSLKNKNEVAKKSDSNPLGAIAFLTNLTGSGKIQIGKLIYKQIPINNLLIQSASANNIVNLSPIKASVYDGSINAKARLNLQASVPTVVADATLSNLDLNKAFSNPGENSRVSGLLSLQTHLTSVGKTPEAWLNNLQGNGSLDVVQGVIKGIDLNFWLLQGISVLKKLTPSLKGNTNQTPFNGMHATFTIYQGVLNNQDLVISTQQLSAKGRGSINIPQQSINYHIFAQSTDKNLLANNLQIPIIVKGSLSNPKVQLDMAVLTASLLKEGLTAPVGAAKAIPGGALDILSKIKF